MVSWLVCGLVGRLVDWLVGWLVGWLIGWLVACVPIAFDGHRDRGIAIDWIRALLTYRPCLTIHNKAGVPADEVDISNYERHDEVTDLFTQHNLRYIRKGRSLLQCRSKVMEVGWDR